MYDLIKSSERAMASVNSVLAHAGVDIAHMDADQMIDLSRNYSASCNHAFDRSYKGNGTRVCTRCGALQDN